MVTKGTMIKVFVTGSFACAYRMLHKCHTPDDIVVKVMQECGQQGVDALASATPEDSGLTASSWSYRIENNGKTSAIIWENSNLANGYFPVAIMLQYGHGTGTGGYVQGVDYINPAIKPVFDRIADTVWKVVCES